MNIETAIKRRIGIFSALSPREMLVDQRLRRFAMDWWSRGKEPCSLAELEIALEETCELLCLSGDLVRREHRYGLGKPPEFRRL